jgi:hypothetical protein
MRARCYSCRTIPPLLHSCTCFANSQLLIFTSDNGPALYHGLPSGSVGLFTARSGAKYQGPNSWNIGKATTWGKPLIR